MSKLFISLSARAARWYKFGGAQVFPTGRFYGLKLAKGDSFSVQNLGDYYMLEQVTVSGKRSQTAVPAAHKINITKLIKASKLAKEPVEKKVVKAKPKTIVTPELQKGNTGLEGDKALVKQILKFVSLFNRYRSKFPKTGAGHMETFQWAKDFSGASNAGSKKIYRGTRLRGEDYSTGKVLNVGHARELISFSGKVSVAKEFALRNNKVGALVKGATYIVEAQVPNSSILLSASILKAIAKKLKALERKDALLASYEYAEFFEDQAYDLGQHEDEYFVSMQAPLKVKIKTKFFDQKKVA